MMRSGKISELWRLARFSLIGGLATVVYLLIALAAVEWAKASPMIAATSGFCASFAVSYLGHFHFTFAVPGRYRDYLLKFAVMSVASFVISTLVMWVATRLLQIDYRIALLAVSIIIPISSYLVNRFWVFLHPEMPASGEPVNNA